MNLRNGIVALCRPFYDIRTTPQVGDRIHVYHLRDMSDWVCHVGENGKFKCAGPCCGHDHDSNDVVILGFVIGFTDIVEGSAQPAVVYVDAAPQPVN